MADSPVPDYAGLTDGSLPPMPEAPLPERATILEELPPAVPGTLGGGSYRVRLPGGRVIVMPKGTIAGAPVEAWEAQRKAAEPIIPPFPGGSETLPPGATHEQVEAARDAQAEWLKKYEKPLFGAPRLREQSASASTPPAPQGPAPVDPSTLVRFGGAPPRDGAPGQVQPASYTREGGSLSIAGSAPGGSPPAARTFQPAGPGRSERDIAGAYRRAAEAEAQATGVAQAKAQADAAYQTELVAQQERAQTEFQQREAERQARVDAAVKQAEDVGRQVVAAANTPGQVDANRWWKDKGTGTKVAAVLSSFLAGFGGDPIGPIGRLIQQDIDAQKDALDRRQGALSAAFNASNSLVALARQTAGDARTADAAAMAAGLDLVKAKAQALLAKFNAPEMQAQGQKLLAAIDMKRAETLEQVRQRAYENSLRERGMQLQEAEASAQAQARAAQARLSGALGDGLENLSKDVRERVVVVNNRPVLALSTKEAETLRDEVAQHATTTDLIQRLAALRQRVGGEALPTDAKKELVSLGAELVGELNKVKKFGALDTGTQKMLQDVAGGDPTGFRDIIPVLASVKTTLDRDLQSRVQVRTGRNLNTGGFRRAE